MKIRMMVVLGGLSLVIACGEGNTEIVNRRHSLVDLQEATTEQCADGGTVVPTGVDTNCAPPTRPGAVSVPSAA